MPTPTKKSPIRGNTDFEYNIAIKQRNQRRLKTLLKHKIVPPKGSLLYAYQLGHTELLPILLDATADPNYIGYRGWTLMGECILKSDIPTLQLLLSRGADPNRGFPDCPSIVQAARVGNIEVLRLLVSSGANLFADPRIAPHALFEAIARRHEEVVDYLIQLGASCTSRKPFGKTAIEWAAEKSTPEIQSLIRNRKSRKKANQAAVPSSRSKARSPAT